MEAYRRLLDVIRSGYKPNLGEFLQAAVEAGRTPEDVIVDLCDPNGPVGSAWPGDRCDGCGGRIIVANVRRPKGFTVRRLVCSECGRRYPDLVLLNNTFCETPAAG